MLPLDYSVAYQRHQDILREAEQIRLARQAARSNRQPSLLSRMVKLLVRPTQPQALVRRTAQTTVQIVETSLTPQV